MFKTIPEMLTSFHISHSYHMTINYKREHCITIVFGYTRVIVVCGCHITYSTTLSWLYLMSTIQHTDSDSTTSIQRSK